MHHFQNQKMVQQHLSRLSFGYECWVAFATIIVFHCVDVSPPSPIVAHYCSQFSFAIAHFCFSIRLVSF
jgi:hypothetical protein